MKQFCELYATCVNAVQNLVAITERPTGGRLLGKVLLPSEARCSLQICCKEDQARYATKELCLAKISQPALAQKMPGDAPVLNLKLLEAGVRHDQITWRIGDSRATAVIHCPGRCTPAFEKCQAACLMQAEFSIVRSCIEAKMILFLKDDCLDLTIIPVPDS